MRQSIRQKPPWHFSSLHCICLRSCLNKKRFWEADGDCTGMLSDRYAGQTPDTDFRGELHLERKSKIILYVRIVQIVNVPVGACTAQTVEVHDLRRRLPVDLRHQMGALCHAVPVEVNGHFQGRIRFDKGPHRSFAFSYALLRSSWPLMIS